jgi:NAD(P)-dependent dehydrogenase (short-subunit alcohol dehydrogenase family)
MLAGKVAVVTGGSRGIGEGIAAAFAREGADVVITSRKPDGVEQAAKRILADDPPGRVLAMAAHSGDPEAAAEVMARAAEEFGPVGILVNNAATNPYMGPLVDIDVPRAEKTASVNMLAPITWTRAAMDHGLEDRGAVVNIASVGGLRIDPLIGYYNATKAALIHVTRQLAWELGPRVRVNAIAPGLIKTELARAIWEPQEERTASLMPMRRLGEVEDIAEAAVFLASDRSSWITGHTLVVDGGALINPVITDDRR